MDQTNFASILDMPAAEIKRPAAMPVGSYVAVVQGLPRFDKSTKKGTDYAEFTLKFLQAGEDVDAEALAAIGGLADKSIKHTFYLTEKSAYRLTEFLTEDLQIENDGSKTVRELVDESPSRQCVVVIKHVASEDGKSVYANIASTAAVA